MRFDPQAVWRGARATLIVAVIGAVGGAIGGGAIAAGVLVFDIVASGFDRLHLSSFWRLAVFTAPFGAVYGVVLGPLYAWTLLRRAPLWRAIGEPAAAAAVGVGLGLLAKTGFALFGVPVLLSAAAAVRLRFALRSRGDRAELAAGDPPDAESSGRAALNG